MSKKSSNSKSKTKNKNTNDYNKYRDSNTRNYSDKGSKPTSKSDTCGTGPREN